MQKPKLPKVYSATAINDKITIFDVNTGMRVISITLPNEIIINGPVVTGDLLSLVSKDRSGVMKGRVYTLPNAALKYSYTVR